MVFDMQQVLDYFIPDSPSDAGAILFWALLIFLAVIIVVDIRLYFSYRTTTHHPETPPLMYPTAEQMNILHKEPTTDITEIRQKVDRLIQLNKL